MGAEPLPDWLYPEGGLTALDLDHLPGLPEHTELIDGGLFFMSPQKRFHMRALGYLEAALNTCVPPELEVQREMAVVLGDRDRLVPDILVIQASAVRDAEADTWYPAEVTELVVEVVSPESAQRDQGRKPQLYARAGIRHFWRVEEVSGKPVVYVYELDLATMSYSLTGIHHDRLVIPVPFPIDIGLVLQRPRI